MTPDDSQTPPTDAPQQNAAPDHPEASASAQTDGELPPLLPFHTPSQAERPLPRGCHPLVFGVVMATAQMAALFYFMPSCFGRPG